MSAGCGLCLSFRRTSAEHSPEEAGSLLGRRVLRSKQGLTRPYVWSWSWSWSCCCCCLLVCWHGWQLPQRASIDKLLSLGSHAWFHLTLALPQGPVTRIGVDASSTSRRWSCRSRVSWLLCDLRGSRMRLWLYSSGTCGDCRLWGSIVVLVVIRVGGSSPIQNRVVGYRRQSGPVAMVKAGRAFSKAQSMCAQHASLLCKIHARRAAAALAAFIAASSCVCRLLVLSVCAVGLSPWVRVSRGGVPVRGGSNVVAAVTSSRA